MFMTNLDLAKRMAKRRIALAGVPEFSKVGSSANQVYAPKNPTIPIFHLGDFILC